MSRPKRFKSSHVLDMFRKQRFLRDESRVRIFPHFNAVKVSFFIGTFLFLLNKLTDLALILYFKMLLSTEIQ